MPPGPAPAVALVLQGHGPFAGFQFQALRDAALQAVPVQEIHAVSSGVAAAACLVLRLSGRPLEETLRDVRSPGEMLRRYSVAPWRWSSAYAEARAAVEAAAAVVGEARLDATLRSLPVFVYSYTNDGRRVTTRARSWKQLLECGARSASIPLITGSSSTHLDGIAVRVGELCARRREVELGQRQEFAAWTTTFPYPLHVVMALFGLAPKAAAPLRAVDLGAPWASCLDAATRPCLLLLRLLRFVELRPRSCVLAGLLLLWLRVRAGAPLRRAAGRPKSLFTRS